jgi:hypothetical protein
VAGIPRSGTLPAIEVVTDLQPLLELHQERGLRPERRSCR